MEYLFIYILQISVLIHAVLNIMVITFITTVIISIILKIIEMLDGAYDGSFEPAKGKILPGLQKILTISAVSALILGLIPNPQTLILSSAIYYGKRVSKQIVTNDKMEKVSTIIDLHLDKYIKELSKEIKE